MSSKELVLRNDIEKQIAIKAIDKYREWQQECREVIELLSTKKFNYGDYVVRKFSNGLDQTFGLAKVGKVVWFDEEHNWYRVRYDDDNAWIGTVEEKMEFYEGKVPQELADYDVRDSTFIRFQHESKEWRNWETANS